MYKITPDKTDSIKSHTNEEHASFSKLLKLQRQACLEQKLSLINNGDLHLNETFDLYVDVYIVNTRVTLSLKKFLPFIWLDVFTNVAMARILTSTGVLEVYFE